MGGGEPLREHSALVLNGADQTILVEFVQSADLHSEPHYGLEAIWFPLQTDEARIPVACVLMPLSAIAIALHAAEQVAYITAHLILLTVAPVPALPPLHARWLRCLRRVQQARRVQLRLVDVCRIWLGKGRHFAR